MLPRNDTALTATQDLQQTHPVQSWLQSSTLQKPSPFHSALSSFGAGYLRNGAALGTDIQSAILGDRTNANKALHSSLEALDMSLENVDTFGQKSTDFVAGLAGQALSLLPLAGEAIGAGVVKVASPVLGKVVSKVAPALLEKQIPKLTVRGLTSESLSAATNRSARYGASFAGFMAPEDIEEAYDVETNSFNWGKAAISMTANGALGAFIPATQFLSGILGAGLRRLKVSETLTHAEEKALPIEHVKAEVQKAVDNGEMTAEEGIWYVDAHENKDPVKIHQDAVRILNKKVPVDPATGNVQLNLMDEEGTKNIQNSVTDQLFNSFEEPQKMAVTDYAIHKSADNMVGNHLLADGIDGWTGHIDEVFAKRADKLAIDEEKMFAGVHDNLEFSQSRMARKIEKLSHEESHVSQLPYTVPDQVVEHLKVQKKIDDLRAKQREQGESKQVTRRIEELEKKQAKLLTPREELKALKDKLITKEGLTPFFEAKKDYHRLVELAHYWPQARKLLDRVHLHRAYDAQKVFRDILDNYSKLIKSNVSRFSNPEKVVNYLKSRLEQTVNKERLNAGEGGSVVKPETSQVTAPPEPTPKLPEDTELEAQRQEVEKSTSEQSKDDYFQSERRVKQFKKSEGVLANLIKCHLGTTNGEI